MSALESRPCGEKREMEHHSAPSTGHPNPSPTSSLQPRGTLPRTSTGLLVKEDVKGKAGGKVTSCVSGSPADFVGTLREGDTIVAVDGLAFRHPEGLHMVRGSDVPGSEVRLMVERAGEAPFECCLVRDSLSAVQVLALLPLPLPFPCMSDSPPAPAPLRRRQDPRSLR